MDEEAQKRNTDCVYFLASPLTCKKGNDCEYRHSETARINPRDCWYWIAGNCLNANCPFRHPPLDGRPASTPAAVAPPPPVPVAPAAPAAAASAASKSRVPCFFFSQGFCAKGDKCAFMHGLPMTPSMEAAASQKPPKAPVVKGMEINDRLVTVSKGNGLTAPKPSSQEVSAAFERRPVAQNESQSAHVKASVPAQDVLLMPNDVERTRAPESSVTSAPSRPRGRQAPSGDDRLRQIHPADDRSHQVQSSDDRLRHGQSGEDRLQQSQSGDDRLRQAQPGDDRLRQGLSGEERRQNGFESEEWWKESSPGFDVLVDDGPDQLVYAEDAEYLSHHDVTLESGRARSRGRMMHPDELTEFEYEHPGVYEQSGYYDTPAGQYDHGSYEHYEQQLSYDHGGSYDRAGRQQTGPYNTRTGEGMPVRERRGMVLEGEMQHSSGDLRNRLAKRRRTDRAQQLSGESHHRRLHQDTAVNNFHHSRRHQDDHPKQQEALMRNQVSVQQGIRPNHRRPSGRADSGGVKRPYHDVGSDYEAASPERISLRSSPSKRLISEHSRPKLKERESGRYASEAASVSEVRSYATSNSKKPEQKKEPSNFAGPKSLAQIKAEKRRAGGEESIRAREMLDEPKSQAQSVTHTNFVGQRPVMALKSQISPAPGSTFDTGHREASSSEERKVAMGKGSTNELTKNPGFEGPKSLSLILKGKKKPESEGDIGSEEARKEFKRCFFTSGLGATKGEVSSANLSFLDMSKDVEDGEVLQDASDITAFSPKVANGNERKYGEVPKQDLSNHRDNELYLREGLASGLTSSNREAGIIEEVQRNRGEEDVRGGMGFSDDIMEDGAEAGDTALEDEEFGYDDDEEDDFAKKLGGFFS